MDSNISLRPVPLPYPESPSVESWLEAHRATQEVNRPARHANAPQPAQVPA